MAKVVELVRVFIEALLTSRYHTEFVDSEAKGRELINSLAATYVAEHWHVRENRKASGNNDFCVYAKKCETHTGGRKRVMNLYLYRTEGGNYKVTAQK